MKVSYSEGLATRTGSESCIFVGNGEGEALTGVRAGQVLSREIEPPYPLASLLTVRYKNEPPRLWMH